MHVRRYIHVYMYKENIIIVTYCIVIEYYEVCEYIGCSRVVGSSVLGRPISTRYLDQIYTVLYTCVIKC